MNMTEGTGDQYLGELKGAEEWGHSLHSASYTCSLQQ